MASWARVRLVPSAKVIDPTPNAGSPLYWSSNSLSTLIRSPGVGPVMIMSPALSSVTVRDAAVIPAPICSTAALGVALAADS